LSRLSGASRSGVMIFPIGASGQTIVLTDEVLAHFRSHRQDRWWGSEAGGQLFARFEEGRILVVEATGPRPSDRRGRTSYHPDKRAERREIVERHSAGLHFVGDWHTHPEAQPTPSVADLQSIADCVRRSSHHLAGFILMVVGTDDPPAGLYLSVHDGHAEVRLKPVVEEGDGVGRESSSSRLRWI
jgi:integrative and conjugative element protein (TIGR02256 family)